MGASGAAKERNVSLGGKSAAATLGYRGLSDFFQVNGQPSASRSARCNAKAAATSGGWGFWFISALLVWSHSLVDYYQGGWNSDQPGAIDADSARRLGMSLPRLSATLFRKNFLLPCTSNWAGRAPSP